MTSKKVDLTPLTVKLHAEINHRLQQLAELKRRSKHWLMREAILLYLEQEEYKEKLI